MRHVSGSEAEEVVEGVASPAPKLHEKVVKRVWMRLQNVARNVDLVLFGLRIDGPNQAPRHVPVLHGVALVHVEGSLCMREEAWVGGPPRLDVLAVVLGLVGGEFTAQGGAPLKAVSARGGGASER